VDGESVALYFGRDDLGIRTVHCDSSGGDMGGQWAVVADCGIGLGIGDDLAVKNTCNASVGSKGFCHYKTTNGIKRHLAVDTLGFPFFTHCTKANVTDDQGLIEMLLQNIDYFKDKPMNIPKITILVDHGYYPEPIIQALQSVYPQMMTKIRFERSPKPSKAEKAAQGKSGLVPVATRWVVERSNAWMERFKSLVKNFEWTLDHARAKLNLCFIRLMLKHLAAG
jgi:transposase